VEDPRREVILVVDDDPDLRDVIRRALGQAGYVVEAAQDGAAGLARLKQGGVDLVLLDRVLPDMDGLTWCREVRAEEGESYLPIIMLTGLAGEADRHEGFAAGADDYISKPFSLEELRDRVGAWMRTRRFLARAQAQQLTQERAALATAMETSHDLTRLLMLVLDLLEAWESGAHSLEDAARLRSEFQDAATVLSAHVNLLRSRPLADQPPA